MNVGSRKNPIYLPTEACVVQPGQVWRKELSDNQSKQMIDFARSDPMVAAEAIAKGGRETLGFVHSSGILVRPDLTLVKTVIPS